MTIANSPPYTLTNGTTADATQVMANFTQLISNVNANAAANGANSDITSLTGITTPLGRTYGGSQYFVGGTSTGSGNAQVVTPTVPTGFALTAGAMVFFIAGFTNTSATTLNVGGTGAKNVYRASLAGPVACVGNEIITNEIVCAAYDGTQYQLLSAGGIRAVLDVAQTFTAAQTIALTSGVPLTAQLTDAGATVGPDVVLFRNSASPAAADILARIRFDGMSSTSVQRTYAAIVASITDPVNATEDALLSLQTIVAGTLANRFLVGQGLYGTGATGGDKGANTINSTNFYKNGTVLPIQQRFQGAFTTWAGAGLVTQAHGLGTTPTADNIRAILKNDSSGTLNGWADQDTFPLPFFWTDAGLSYGLTMYADATNVYARIGANGLVAFNKLTGAQFAPSSPNYKISLVALA